MNELDYTIGIPLLVATVFIWLMLVRVVYKALKEEE